jgi:hypothetical protein
MAKADDALNKERLVIDEKARANTAIALLAAARDLLVAADREGPRGSALRLFRSTRAVCAQIESIETRLVKFIDSPSPTTGGGS